MLAVGDVVMTWFDTGAGKMGGMVPLYGVVIAAGPKASRVRWESGLTNRLRQDTRVEVKTDAETIEYVRDIFRRRDLPWPGVEVQ